MYTGKRSLCALELNASSSSANVMFIYLLGNHAWLGSLQDLHIENGQLKQRIWIQNMTEVATNEVMQMHIYLGEK